MIHHHWDFFGPDSRKTAEHFQKHVCEFAETLSVRIDEEGFFSASPAHVCYWIAIEDEPMAELTQKKLRPKRSMRKPEHIRLLADVGQD